MGIQRWLSALKELRIAFVCPLAVEALDEQDILAAHGLDVAFDCGEAAFARKSQHGMLDPGVVPAIVRPFEFSDPQRAAGLHEGLGTPRGPSFRSIHGFCSNARKPTPSAIVISVRSRSVLEHRAQDANEQRPCDWPMKLHSVRTLIRIRKPATVRASLGGMRERRSSNEQFSKLLLATFPPEPMPARFSGRKARTMLTMNSMGICSNGSQSVGGQKSR
jgi:hypothetical protein